MAEQTRGKLNQLERLPNGLLVDAAWFQCLATLPNMAGFEVTTHGRFWGDPRGHRRFLLSFKRGEPDWSLLRIPGVSELPAVRWRQQNLDKLTRDERIRLVLRLENVFAQASAAE